MADLCIECEQLWREYSATMHEYLGLSGALGPAGASRELAIWRHSVVVPRAEIRPILVAIKERISQHECTAHPDVT
jgi:hypothetical protein